MKKHYVYYHLNPITKEIFYVGVGYNKRAWNFKWGRSIYYLNYVKKYGTPLVDIIKKDTTENKAYLLEIKLIKKYGRKGLDKDGILVNRSIGGKTSALGTKHYITDEWKKKIGDANRGKKKHSNEVKKSISLKNSRSIIQYDLNNKFIKEYSSIKEASIITGIKKNLIDSNLQNFKNNCNTGFIWKYKNEQDKKLRRGKKIIQYNFEGKIIKEWDSIAQAQRGLKIVGINQFLKGNSHYVGKQKFKFKLK